MSKRSTFSRKGIKLPYIIMLLAGIGIPVLAAMNASLGRHLGSPAAAASVLFSVALLVAVIVALLTAPQGYTRVGSAPKYLFLAGTLIAFYLLSITWIAPIIGISSAIFLVLVGQIISATLIGHFGLFGAIQTPISLVRVAGISMMALGVFLTIKA